MSDLTPKQAAFVADFIATGGRNPTGSARTAQYGSPEVAAHRLLRNAKVREAVAHLLGPAILSDAERVVAAWKAIATADHRQLIEYRRGACRFCYGEGFRYQRTAAERERDHGEHQQMLGQALSGQRSAAMLKAIPPFDELGGIGYNPNKAPKPDCPECFGDGAGRVLVADTRTLSPEAAELYAGVKVTRDGIEVKTHDKATALAALAKFHKLAGHTPDAGEGAPQVHLHLHLVKALEGLSAAEREAARPLLARLAGASKA